MMEKQAKKEFEELTKYNRGRDLEKLVERVVSPYYSRFPGYRRVLSDIYVPSVNGNLTQIDVIMIHETGIYVFECKDTHGSLYANGNSKLWTYSTRYNSYQMFSPVEQNRLHLESLAEYLKLDDFIFKSWIVFSTFAKVYAPNGNAVITPFNKLTAQLSRTMSESSVCLTPKEIDRIANKLQSCVDIPYSKRLEHLKMIRSIGRR